MLISMIKESAVMAAGTLLSPTSVRQRTGASRDTFEQAVFQALDLSDNVVFIVDWSNGGLIIAEANKAAERVTGYAAENLIDEPLAMLFAPEADPTAVEALAVAAREGRSHATQLPCLTRQRRPFWLGLQLLPTNQPGDRCFAVLGTDVTSKLRQQEQAQTVQSLLAKVFVTVDAPVYVLDLEGRFIMTNPAFDRLVGAKQGALAGTAMIEFYPPSHHEKLAAAREKQNADGLEYSLDVPMVPRTGGEIPCVINVVMIQRPDLLRFRIVTVRAQVSSAPPKPTVTVAGRIKLVGLEEVRQSLGSRWEALRERAMATAEAVLRRRLGPTDTFSVTGDSGFVICFAAGTEEEAAFRAATIGAEIRRRLIGEGETPEVAHVFAAAVDLPPGADALPAGDLAVIAQNRFDQKLRTIQDTARKTLVAALEAGGHEADPVHLADRADAIGWCVRLPAATQRAIDVATGLLPAGETATLDPNLLVLGAAQDRFLEDATSAAAQLLVVTFGPEILRVRKRMEAIVAACRAMSEPVRQQMVFLIEVPADITTRQLDNNLPRLRPFCRFLGLAAETFDALDVDLRGLNVSMMLIEADAPGAKGAAKVKARADSLRGQRCRLLIGGATQAAAARLFADGANFVAFADLRRSSAPSAGG